LPVRVQFIYSARLCLSGDRTEDYRKKASELYGIGGYYSKFKHGFIFREQPKVQEIETALNGRVPRKDSGIGVYRTEYNSEGLISLVRNRKTVYIANNSITSPEYAWTIFNDIFRLDFATEEMFCMLALDTKCQAVAAFVVSHGDLSASIVHPREIFKKALLCNAAAVIFAHNHPSGDTTPSSDDIATTRKIADAGQILGITVQDHIIIANNDYIIREKVSFQISKKKINGGDSLIICPSCNSRMIYKNGTSEEGRKYEFYGCSKYPSCTCTVKIEDADKHDNGEKGTPMEKQKDRRWEKF